MEAVMLMTNLARHELLPLLAKQAYGKAGHVTKWASLQTPSNCTSMCVIGGHFFVVIWKKLGIFLFVIDCIVFILLVHRSSCTSTYFFKERFRAWIFRIHANSFSIEELVMKKELANTEEEKPFSKSIMWFSRLPFFLPKTNKLFTQLVFFSVLSRLCFLLIIVLANLFYWWELRCWKFWSCLWWTLAGFGLSLHHNRTSQSTRNTATLPVMSCLVSFVYRV